MFLPLISLISLVLLFNNSNPHVPTLECMDFVEAGIRHRRAKTNEKRHLVAIVELTLSSSIWENNIVNASVLLILLIPIIG